MIDDHRCGEFSISSTDTVFNKGFLLKLGTSRAVSKCTLATSFRKYHAMFCPYWKANFMRNGTMCYTDWRIDDDDCAAEVPSSMRHTDLRCA